MAGGRLVSAVAGPRAIRLSSPSSTPSPFFSRLRRRKGAHRDTRNLQFGAIIGVREINTGA